MKVNENYSINQIEATGLVEKNIKDLEAKVYTKDNKVYFFEELENRYYRLYSIINKRSFFL